MDDPYIRVVHSGEGDCVAHAVTALCGKRVFRRKRHCTVEKTSAPQIELVHSGNRECIAHIYGCVVGAENVLLMRQLDRKGNDYTGVKVVV